MKQWAFLLVQRCLLFGKAQIIFRYFFAGACFGMRLIRFFKSVKNKPPAVSKKCVDEFALCVWNFAPGSENLKASELGNGHRWVNQRPKEHVPAYNVNSKGLRPCGHFEFGLYCF